RNASSTPQKQPAANAASAWPGFGVSGVPSPTLPGSVPTGRRPSGPGWMRAEFMIERSGSGEPWQPAPRVTSSVRRSVEVRIAMDYAKLTARFPLPLDLLLREIPVGDPEVLVGDPIVCALRGGGRGDNDLLARLPVGRARDAVGVHRLESVDDADD